MTGGRDNTIQVLTRTAYSIIFSIDISKQIPDCLHPRIRSIEASKDSKDLLIGTYSSEIYHLSTNDVKINGNTKFEISCLLKGHYAPSCKGTYEVWGLEIVDNGDHFLTVSDDATLRMWSSSQKRIVKYLQLDIDDNNQKLGLDHQTNELQDQAKLRSISVSSDKIHAAIGCKDGTIREWTQVKMFKDRGQWIQVLKYSPDGQLLAVGSHDNYIDLYNTSDYRRRYALRKHSSFITHLDWTTDSKFLQSNCGGLELLYWDMTQGKQLPDGASMLRDAEWASWSCVLGWPVQGIWESYMDGSDINSVERYPCLKKGAGAIVGRGHSSHVTNVKWEKGDEYIYTTGGLDQTVIIWKVEID